MAFSLGAGEASSVEHTAGIGILHLRDKPKCLGKTIETSGRYRNYQGPSDVF
jgi:hypothetical protein